MTCKIWSARPQLICLSCQWPPPLLFTALPPPHAYEKAERTTDSNNKEAEASRLGAAAASPLAAAHLPSLLPRWPHVFLSLRQQPNYTRFIQPHSIFILIMLNGAANKWLTLVKRGRNWWEMQMTGEAGVSAKVTASERELYWLWNGQLFNFSACYYCIKMRLCSISAN